MEAFDRYFTALRNKTVTVLGLGVSNRPLLRLLLRYGCAVTGRDRTPREKLSQEVLALEAQGCRLILGEDYLENLTEQVIFRTPGLHPDTPALAAARERGAEVTSEMEAFFTLCPCPIIGVTGSDGKTTTTTLIAEMLRAGGKTVWLGGNIGTPLLDRCPQMGEEDLAVVELSSFQLLDMKHSPHIAVVTNLAPNHLDVHKDMAEYVEAKKNIFRFQNREDLLILNADNEITAGFTGVGRTLYFSRKGPVDGAWCDGEVLRRPDRAVMAKSDILLPGEHNVENYLAALLAAGEYVPDEAARQVARSFRGVEHRIELVRTKDGVRYYNDSIASSPTRTLAALASFPEKVLLIAGGYDKHIPYDPLGPAVCRKAKKLFLGGATGPKIRQAVESCPEYAPGAPEIVDCGDFASAVRAAAAAAEPGDVVLMSPASAAFDQFANFAVRGAVYKKIVEEL